MANGSKLCPKHQSADEYRGSGPHSSSQCISHLHVTSDHTLTQIFQVHPVVSRCPKFRFILKSFKLFQIYLFLSHQSFHPATPGAKHLRGWPSAAAVQRCPIGRPTGQRRFRSVSPPPGQSTEAWRDKFIGKSPWPFLLNFCGDHW